MVQNICSISTNMRHIPANIYLFIVNNRNTRKRCEISSKLTTILLTSRWCFYCYKHYSHLFLLFLLLTLNKCMLAGMFDCLTHCEPVCPCSKLTMDAQDQYQCMKPVQRLLSRHKNDVNNAALMILLLTLIGFNILLLLFQHILTHMVWIKTLIQLALYY